MRLVFSERFNNPALPRWTHRGQEYRPDSQRAKGSPEGVAVSNGILSLRVVPDLDFSGYLTGHIGTEEHFQFTYGRATARMKVHPYHGAHSAFWLQSVNPYAVGRPEIDVAECFGAHNPDRESGVQMWHNVFYRPTDDSPILTARKSANSKDFGGPWHTGYHDYTVDWSPDAYRFSIDGQVTAMITEGLSDTPKYLVLSILARDFEVGEIANHPITTYLTQVKWVKVWQ